MILSQTPVHFQKSLLDITSSRFSMVLITVIEKVLPIEMSNQKIFFLMKISKSKLPTLDLLHPLKGEMEAEHYLQNLEPLNTWHQKF